jgi:hypothetical protein
MQVFSFSFHDRTHGLTVLLDDDGDDDDGCDSTSDKVAKLGDYFVAWSTFNLNSSNEILALDELPFADWLATTLQISAEQFLVVFQSYLLDVCLKRERPSDTDLALCVFFAHTLFNAKVTLKLWPPDDSHHPVCPNVVFSFLCRLNGFPSAYPGDSVFWLKVQRLVPEWQFKLSGSPKVLMNYEAEVLDNVSQHAPLVGEHRGMLAIDVYDPGAYRLLAAVRIPKPQILVPPCDRYSLYSVVLPLSEARERLAWATYELLPHTWPLGDLPIVLGGSLLPLCFLPSIYKTDSREHFLAYANENYATRSVDFFVYGMPEMDIMRLFYVISMRLDRTPDSFAFVRRYQHLHMGVEMRVLELAVAVGAGRTIRMQIVHMPSADQPVDTFLYHHLPLVRAGYNGTTLLMTPCCYASWFRRMCIGYIHFLDYATAPKSSAEGEPPTITPDDDDVTEYAAPYLLKQRWSRLMLKWAIRGFGFPRSSRWALPRRIDEWIRDNLTTYEDLDDDSCIIVDMPPLPWYHPLYLPSTWTRYMSDEEVRACLACEESALARAQ